MVAFYFLTIALMPFYLGAPALLVTAGLVCLLLGLFFAWQRPSRRLLWMALPFLLSELLVVSTSLAAGKLSRDLTAALMNAYLLAIGVAVAVLIWRAAGSRIAAALLGYAGFSYALVAAFFAYMGFSGDWI